MLYYLKMHFQNSGNLHIAGCGSESQCIASLPLLRCPAETSPIKAGAFLTDRCHSLPSLPPPLAAVESLPLRHVSRYAPAGNSGLADCWLTHMTARFDPLIVATLTPLTCSEVSFLYLNFRLNSQFRLLFGARVCYNV